MKSTYFLLLLAIIAGALLPLQAGLNAKMGNAVGNASLGALVSFLVGSAGIVLYLALIRTDFTQMQNAATVDWSVWLGGLMGAFYVIATIILVPKIGATLTFGLAVAGQMAFSLLADHYGWVGLPVNHITWQRFLGVLLIISGVLMIRNF